MGTALDPATALDLRQLRATNRRQAQELDMLKKAIATFSQTSDPLVATASSPPSAASAVRRLCQVLDVLAGGFYAW